MEACCLNRNFLYLIWLLCAPAWAGQADLSWTYPTQNVDGSVLTDLSDFNVYRRCGLDALVVIATVPASTSAPTGGEESGYIDSGIPDDGQTCWYSISARNTLTEESARTNEVSKTFTAAGELPGNVAATFTWTVTEPPTVAKSLVGEDFDYREATGSTTLTVTLPTTQDGDFAVISMSLYNGNTGGATDVDVSAAPSGFTNLFGPVGIDGAGTGSGTSEGWVWYRECDGTESGADRTVVLTVIAYVGITLAVYRGDGALTYKTSSLGTLARGTSSDAAATAAGVDAAVGDLIVMPTMIGDPPGTTNSNPSGLGLIAEGNTNTNTTWIHAGESSSAGSTGTKTWDFTNSRDWLTYQFLVTDAGAAATASLPPINRSARMAAMIAH